MVTYNCLIRNVICNLAGLEELSQNQNMAVLEEEKQKHWFVMRDLKRANAKLPAYKLLADEHFEVFTPVKERLSIRGGKKIREEVSLIPDLFFIHDTQEAIDVIVEKHPTIQYRFLKGGGYKKPMTVTEADMERFIHAVTTSQNLKFYLPGELTPAMCGCNVRIVGGSFDGYEGKLLTVRGSKTKRLLVELPEFFLVGVEINPEYIKIL